MTHWAVVLAGGVGSRFWPVSTPARPKQLLPLASAEPMLADALSRLAPLAPARAHARAHERGPGRRDRRARPEPAAGEHHRRASAGRHRRGAGMGGARDRAPWRSRRRDDQRARRLGDRRRGRIPCGAALGGGGSRQEQHALVTVGVVPVRPDPGFGYIQPGESVGPAARRVARFVEKPDRARAERMVRRRLPLELGHLRVARGRLPRRGRSAHARDRAASRRSPRRPRRSSSPRSRRISVDVGVMERSARVLVLPGDFGWDDVGTWAALRRVRTCDERGNALSGSVHALEARDNVVHADGNAVVLYGVTTSSSSRATGSRSSRRRSAPPTSRSCSSRCLPRSAISRERRLSVRRRARARLRAVRADPPGGRAARGRAPGARAWARALGRAGGGYVRRRTSPDSRSRERPRSLGGAPAAGGLLVANARFAPALDASRSAATCSSATAASSPCGSASRSPTGDAAGRRGPRSSARRTARLRRRVGRLVDGRGVGLRAPSRADARRGPSGARRRRCRADAAARRRYASASTPCSSRRARSWSRTCASTPPPVRCSCERRRTCRRSRGSSARSTLVRAQRDHDRPHRCIVDRRHVQGARRDERHDPHRPLEQGARRLRRPLHPRPLGEPRRRHDHEQPEEHVRHRGSSGRRRGCARRGCSSSARCSATTPRPASALRLTTGCVLGAGAQRVRQRRCRPRSSRRSRGGGGRRSRRTASTSSSRWPSA